MYPPLDARLLEARAAALTLAVSHLILVARYECEDKKRNFSWIDHALQDINLNLIVSVLSNENTHKLLLFNFRF